MNNNNSSTLNIPNARFIFRTNFAGREDRFNNLGDRNFNVVLEGDALKDAEAFGMNIKYTNPDIDGNSTAYIKVNVSYKIRAPHIELINSRSKRILTENSVNILDEFDYDHIDMVIRPNRWKSPSGDTGVNAYLQSLYAVISEDPFVARYYDIPEASGGAEEEE